MLYQYSSDDSVIEQTVVRKSVQCAAQCMQNSLCQTAIFNRTNGICLLLREIDLGEFSSNNQAVTFQQNKSLEGINPISATIPTATATTTAILSQYGVQLNFDPALLPNGWTRCYKATYASTLSSSDLETILDNCSKNNLLLGCRPVGQRVMTVAAMGSRSSVLYNCGSSQYCSYVDNGVAWYYSTSCSWGFARGGDSVSRYTCDQSSTNEAYRLCWHTQAIGGYRCGATTELNSNTTWEKIIFHAD